MDLENSADLSYEQVRNDNIKRNEEFLKHIGVDITGTAASSSRQAHKKGSRKPSPTSSMINLAVPVRRSFRLSLQESVSYDEVHRHSIMLFLTFFSHLHVVVRRNISISSYYTRSRRSLKSVSVRK
jgi:hypothetical protein